MEVLSNITIRKTKQSRLHETDFSDLGFGKYISDHMLICDYEGSEWQQPQVVPFANLSLSPATLALHYGQSVFEGMKAFKTVDSRVHIFRPERHYARFARSLERMCMAVPPRELFMEGLQRLVQTDLDWVPGHQGSSLYIRPFVFASEAKMGVAVSNQYRFVTFTGPVQELYADAIRVKVETGYIRAAKGGTGFAKCAGNYGGAFYPTQLARQEGFDQLLWTDGGEDPLIEESGMMNAMFVLDGKLVTAPLSDTILDGVTRDSLLTLASDAGIEVVERPVSVSELEAAFINGTMTEAFGAGTAAVITPIGTINIYGQNFSLPAYTDSSIHRLLKKELDGIRYGTRPDNYGWCEYF